MKLPTWLDPGGLEEILQRPCVVVLVLQSVAHIVPQLCIVFVNLKVNKVFFFFLLKKQTKEKKNREKKKEIMVWFSKDISRQKGFLLTFRD